MSSDALSRSGPGPDVDNEKTARIALFVFIALFLGAWLWAALSLVATHPLEFMTRDSYAYARSGQAVLETGHFAISPRDATPQTALVPGYPVFLAAVFGSLGESPLAVSVFQALLVCVTAWMVFLLGQIAASPPAGAVAAAIFLLDPNVLGLSLYTLSETLFTSLLTLTILLAVRARLRNSQWTALAAGLAFAAATLTREISLYFFLILAAYLLVSKRHGLRFELKWRWCLPFMLGAILLLAPWAIRTRELTGSWGLAQIDAMDLLFYRAADVLATADGTTLSAARQQLGGGDYHALRRFATEHPDSGLGRVWRRRALKTLFAHPVVWTERMARHAAVLLFDPADDWLTRPLAGATEKHGPIGDLLRFTVGKWVRVWLIERPVAGLIFLWACLFLLASYLGTLVAGIKFFARGRGGTVAAIAIATVVYFTSISAGPEAYCRFRGPMAPVLALLASLGLMTLGKRLKSARGGTP